MLRVGVTGGIGSGKTIVCMIFNHLGIPVYSADAAAKLLVEENHDVRTSVAEAFGEDIYEAGTGKLRRKKLASIVFSNSEALEKLNAIVHPAMKTDFTGWLGKQHDVPYIIKEAAIMFESKSHLLLDKVITITAPVELRIKRVVQRDGIDKTAVEQRMRNQMSDKEKIGLSDYVIHNDEKKMVIPQILKIHEDIISRANS